MMRLSAFALATVVLFPSCETAPEKQGAEEQQPKAGTAIPQDLSIPAPAPGELPVHEFSRASRPGNRSQVRAMTPRHPKTEEEWLELAKALCKDRPTDHFLVIFFNSPVALENWDGSGLLWEHQRPYWLCRVIVDRAGPNKLKAKLGKLGWTDDETGEPRADVIRDSRP